MEKTRVQQEKFQEAILRTTTQRPPYRPPFTDNSAAFKGTRDGTRNLLSTLKAIAFIMHGALRYQISKTLEYNLEYLEKAARGRTTKGKFPEIDATYDRLFERLRADLTEIGLKRCTAEAQEDLKTLVAHRDKLHPSSASRALAISVERFREINSANKVNPTALNWLHTVTSNFNIGDAINNWLNSGKDNLRDTNLTVVLEDLLYHIKVQVGPSGNSSNPNDYPTMGSSGPQPTAPTIQPQPNTSSTSRPTKPTETNTNSSSTTKTSSISNNVPRTAAPSSSYASSLFGTPGSANKRARESHNSNEPTPSKKPDRRPSKWSKQPAWPFAGHKGSGHWLCQFCHMDGGQTGKPGYAAHLLQHHRNSVPVDTLGVLTFFRDLKDTTGLENERNAIQRLWSTQPGPTDSSGHDEQSDEETTINTEVRPQNGPPQF